MDIHVILSVLTVGPAINEVPESAIAEQPPEQNPEIKYDIKSKKLKERLLSVLK